MDDIDVAIPLLRTLAERTDDSAGFMHLPFDSDDVRRVLAEAEQVRDLLDAGGTPAVGVRVAGAQARAR